MKYKTTLCLWLITFLPCCLQAQSTPAEEELYKFRVIGWNRNHLDMFYVMDAEPQPLRLIQKVPSALQKIPKPSADLIFYLPVEGEQGIRPQPLVKATLYPPPAQNLVVIWVDQAGRYRSAVLKQDRDNPSPGKLRMVNFTGYDLRIQANKNPLLSLAPGASEVITPENEGVGVKIAYRAHSGEEWEMGLMSGITVRKNDRVTAFIADPSQVDQTLEEKSTSSALSKEPLTLFVIRDRD
ncbi:hypothetical protein P3T73_17510 [Kiritimatiellota bacterium B12222]|nr:hypothetical protein P3T73_17510 [Kiritimatiellota bacterium B12222]